ncbi:probable non-intrinsic ABC protein 5 [Arachis ipaensis]|uniref:probable non-intrinsic ABC protein 5 n=1 Tax=Arachis ipaensis TaxID=130454 RepID=UPI0007AF191C|nr:probable non-intrinsic ABC protein 5 [Arachis ipaensis]XP_025678447.1 probable non-intrinsic ABC protein 5 [Arachis hypogaea]
MKNGKITQCGKYADLLNNGTDFMELVDFPISHSGVKEEEKKDEQNDKIGNKGDEAKGQLVQAEERESGRVEFSVYWQYITMVYGGALVPFILLAHTLFQVLQIGSNYWMAWATPISQDVEPPVSGTTLIAGYIALAVGSSFCILARTTLVAISGATTGDSTGLELNSDFSLLVDAQTGLSEPR